MTLDMLAQVVIWGSFAAVAVSGVLLVCCAWQAWRRERLRAQRDELADRPGRRGDVLAEIHEIRELRR